MSDVGAAEADKQREAQLENLLALSRQDDGWRRSRWFAGLDRWLARGLVNTEDAFVVRRVALLLLTCAFGAYANFDFSWHYVDIFYLGLLANGGAAGRFLHIVSHRRVFVRKLDWLNVVPTWLASCWMGDPPYLFATEHVVNHHAQDNGPRDLSCTMRYRRDSWKDLGCYLLDFLFGRSGIFGIAALFRAGRGGRIWKRRFLGGQAIFWALVVVRMWQDWVPTTVLLLGPFFFLQIANRTNNWTEHAFIDPRRPLDLLGNCYTIVGSSFNTGIGCNEGYHYTHHRAPGLPNHLWPRHFRDHIHDVAASGHLVFRGISTNGIFVRLMLKNFRSLARHYVPLPGQRLSEDAVIQILRERVAPIGGQTSPETSRTAA
jgi:fatty acid desaturase